MRLNSHEFAYVDTANGNRPAGEGWTCRKFKREWHEDWELFLRRVSAKPAFKGLEIVKGTMTNRFGTVWVREAS